jgi:hypothetical protein
MVADLLDPAKGYVLVRSCFTDAEVDAYRDECEAFLETGPVCHARINSDTVRDYVQPRSHDDVSRTVRIYQHLHNRHSPATNAFFSKAFALRNEIEQTWIHDAAYAAERLRQQDYLIVTRYIEGTGFLPRHPDQIGTTPFPLLQSLVLLSSTPGDYTGGDFILYRRAGEPLSLARDIGARKSDLFLFDRSLDHTVELTRRGTTTNRGRWSVLVGARAFRDSRTRAFLKRSLYSPPLYPYSRPIAKLLRMMKIPV